jgi:hypothetical protein
MFETLFTHLYVSLTIDPSPHRPEKRFSDDSGRKWFGSPQGKPVLLHRRENASLLVFLPSAQPVREFLNNLGGLGTE